MSRGHSENGPDTAARNPLIFATVDDLEMRVQGQRARTRLGQCAEGAGIAAI